MSTLTNALIGSSSAVSPVVERHIYVRLLSEHYSKKAKAPKYMLWQDDITKIKQASSNLEVYEALINSYKQAEILYIDDFFKTRRGDFVSTADVNATFKIINYRYNEGLPTVITSELSLEQISQIDEALGSRISEMANPKIFY